MAPTCCKGEVPVTTQVKAVCQQTGAWSHLPPLSLSLAYGT